MITYGLVVSAATGSSLNTAFSLVASNLPLSYQFGAWNLTSGTIGIHFGKSLPTATTTEQVYIPSNGTYASDANVNQPSISEGQNVYLRCHTTAVVSNSVIMDFTR